MANTYPVLRSKTAIKRYVSVSTDTPVAPAASAEWWQTDTGNFLIYDGSSWGIAGIGGSPVATIGYQGWQHDAFGRLRVSNPETLFDSKQLFDNQPLFWDDQEESGGSTTSTHSVDTASTTLGVAATTAGLRTRQTFMRFNYQPGKSQLAFITFVIDKSGGGSGINRYIGLLDDENGIFFGDASGTYGVGVRSSVSGSPSDSFTNQANWNIDQMTGAGPSGVSLDFTKSQILVIDFEWLGVGKIRWGFVVDGAIHYCHSENQSNAGVGVYMSTPNLPVRYQIENQGAGAASTMECICSTIITEGGSNDLGILRHADSGSVSGLSSGSTYATLGIRLKSTHLGASIKLENLSTISTSVNDQAHWALYLNPTVAGTFTYTGVTNGCVEIATGSSSNTITGGTEIDGGYFSTTQPSTITIPNARRLGAAIDDTVDEIVLVVRAITNNITVETSLTWREVS